MAPNRCRSLSNPHWLTHPMRACKPPAVQWVAPPAKNQPKAVLSTPEGLVLTMWLRGWNYVQDYRKSIFKYTRASCQSCWMVNESRLTSQIDANCIKMISTCDPCWLSIVNQQWISLRVRGNVCHRATDSSGPTIPTIITLNLLQAMPSPFFLPSVRFNRTSTTGTTISFCIGGPWLHLVLFLCSPCHSGSKMI